MDSILSRCSYSATVPREPGALALSTSHIRQLAIAPSSNFGRHFPHCFLSGSKPSVNYREGGKPRVDEKTSQNWGQEAYELLTDITKSGVEHLEGDQERPAANLDSAEEGLEVGTSGRPADAVDSSRNNKHSQHSGVWPSKTAPRAVKERAVWRRVERLNEDNANSHLVERASEVSGAEAHTALQETAESSCFGSTLGEEADGSATRAPHEEGQTVSHNQRRDQSPSLDEAREMDNGSYSRSSSTARGRQPLPRDLQRLEERQLRIRALVERLAALASKDDVAAALEQEGGQRQLSTGDLNLVLKQLLSRRHWQAGLKLYSWMRERGMKPSLQLLTKLLALIGAARQWPKMESTVSDMISGGYQLDAHVYATFIAAYTKARLFKDAIQWFDRMHTDGCLPNQVVYTSAIQLHTAAGNFQEAANLCSILRTSSEFRPDAKACCTMVNAYGRAGLLEEAQEVFKQHASNFSNGALPNAATWNALLTAYDRAGMPEKAAAVVDAMRAANCQPTATTFNSLVHAYGRAGRLEDAETAFQELLNAGLPPDTVSYNTLLALYSSMVGGGEPKISHPPTKATDLADSCIAKASRLLCEMRMRGCRLDRFTYSTTMAMYGRLGLANDAEALFQEMKDEGIQMDVQVHAVRINTLSSAGRLKEAVEAYQELIASRLEPTSFVRATMVEIFKRLRRHKEAELIARSLLRVSTGQKDNQAIALALTYLARSGQLSKAEAAVSKLRYEGQPLDGSVIAAMIDSYGRSGRIQQAVQLFNETKVAGTLNGDVAIHTAMISAYGRANMLQEAAAVFDAMRNDASRSCPVAAYNAMIEALRKGDQVEAAVELFNEMADDGCPPSVTTYTIMIDLYGKQGHLLGAAKMFAAMQDAGLPPNTVTYNTLISIYGRRDMLLDVAELYREMQRSRYSQPDATTFHTLIGLYHRANCFQDADRVFRAMLAAQVEPDERTYARMVGIYTKAGDLLKANELNRKRSLLLKGKKARQRGQSRKSPP